MTNPTERCYVVDQLIAWLEEAGRRPSEAPSKPQETPNAEDGLLTPPENEEGSWRAKED